MNLLQLPSDVLIEIFTFLSLPDFVGLNQICKELYRLINDSTSPTSELLWKSFFASIWFPNPQVLLIESSNTQKLWKTTFVKRYKERRERLK